MPTNSFDDYATRYDGHFTHSPIGMLQRKLVYKKLVPLLSKDKQVLELNCGTGHDAISLIQYVASFLATDRSPSMIDVCEQKAQGKIPHLNFRVLSVQEIKNELRDHNFIFSNFGGLNCLSPSEIKDFAATCREQTNKNTDFFLVIMGRKCIWERLYFILKSNFTKANRRKNNHAVASHIGTATFDTWYYSPGEMKLFFENSFEVVSYGAIGLFVPPSYLNSFFANKKALLRVFDLMDNFFCNFKRLANYGDHFYIHLKKTD